MGLWWMPQDLTNDQSTLVQIMAWCHQVTSHCLKQCWTSYMTPYKPSRPQWVKSQSHQIVRFCNFTIVDNFMSERLVVRVSYVLRIQSCIILEWSYEWSNEKLCDCSGLEKGPISRSVLANRTTCPGGLRLILRSVTETCDWSYDQL